MQAFHLIITIRHILIIFIWIIMYAHPKQKKTPTHFRASQLGHFAPAACLFRCACFCRIHDKVLTAQQWIPATQSPLANCSIWLCGVFFPQADQYSLWSLNKQKQWALMGGSTSVLQGFTIWCMPSPRHTQFATGFHFNNGPQTRGAECQIFLSTTWETAKVTFTSWYQRAAD